jgi:hypothetical protein
MQPEALARFAALYARGHAFASGAAAILNDWAGRPAGAPVPLSLSHGVDFGHCFAPMDADSLEPAHWCYTERMQARAAPIKPTVLLPHPWLLLARDPAPPGAGTLVIGPPPGPANDRALLAHLRAAGIGPATLLVKQVGAHRESARFWQDAGFGVTGVAPRGGQLYAALRERLGEFATVVGVTFSSALVFAAALGREVRLLPGYRYRSHFPGDYFHTVDFASADARAVVETFCAGSTADTRACALRLLGADLAVTPEQARARLDAAVASLTEGLHGLRHAPAWLRRALFAAAGALDRPALARLDRRTLAKALRRHQVLDLEIDEVGLWRSGGDPRYRTMRAVRYVPGRTEPGMAVEQYAAGAPA